jgi:hypothetical protein
VVDAVLAMSAALASPSDWRPGPIAPEYLGQARSLRDRLKVVNVECSRAIDHIAAPLVARSKRSPIPRREQLTDVAREWACMPSFGLLDTTIELVLGKRSLHIRQLRAGASDFRATGWKLDEPGISVVGLVLDIAAHRFTFVMPTLVSVSLHCLARRYQRGLEVSEEAIFADLHILAKAHLRLAGGAVGDSFEVEAGGGCWRGCVSDASTNAGRDLILSARTFIT